MRHAVLLLTLLALACSSDSTGPVDFRPAEKTHDLTLTTCVACTEENAPDLVRIWQNGVRAQITVENVNSVGAMGTIQALSVGQSSLVSSLEATVVDISRLTTGAYHMSVGYGDGRISISLRRAASSRCSTRA